MRIVYFRGAVDRDNGGAGCCCCWSAVPRLIAKGKIGKKKKRLVAGQAFILAHIITRRSLHEYFFS